MVIIARDQADNAQFLYTDEEGRLRVLLTDGTTTAEIDPDLGALKVVDRLHALIHAEKHFVCSDIDLAVAIATPKYWRITAPATSKRIHFDFVVCTSAISTVELYENPTITAAGTALAEQNNDRNSLLNASATCFKDTTVSSDGTMLIECVAASGSKGGGEIGSRREFILKQGEDYLVKVTPSANNTITACTFYWAEI